MLKNMRNWRNHVGIMLPILFFAALLLIFSLERLAIRFFLPQFFTDASSSQTLVAMLIGLRFDIVAAATLACPFIALIIAGPLFNRPRFKKIISALISLILGLVIFCCICDFYFFQKFSERLNHKAIVYLDSDYVYKIIWKDYPMITIALIFCLSSLLLYKALTRFLSSRLNRAAIPVLSIAEVVLVPAIMISLAIVGIRGTLGPKAINTGPAYFCSSASIAQLTLNGLFTLREAAFSLKIRQENLNNNYTLLPPKEAVKNTLALVSQPGDTFCETAANPLRRITDTGLARNDYNVVLVVLESLSWHYVGAMGANPGYTPNFDKLIAQGAFMDECFAVGNRTTRGFSAIVSGYPDLPGKSVSTRPQAEGTFLTLGSVLKARGYETMFIYGGQPSYDHRQAFLGSNGYTRMVFKNDFAARTFKTWLGYCDEDLYSQAHLEFQKYKDQPFFATLLTLSFHQEYEIPAGKITSEPASTPFHDQIDAIRYTDWAIGRFVEQASTADYFKKTIFVFVADHMGGFKELPNTAASYRVPFLIYAPGIVQPARISAVCSQLDVAPTIMHLLGGSYEHCFFGSSVLARKPDSGFAWILNGQQFIFINGLRQGVIISPGNHSTFFTFSRPDILGQLDSDIPTAQLRQMPLSILQVAGDIFKNGAYNLGPSNSLAKDSPPAEEKGTMAYSSSTQRKTKAAAGKTTTN